MSVSPPLFSSLLCALWYIQYLCHHGPRTRMDLLWLSAVVMGSAQCFCIVNLFNQCCRELVTIIRLLPWHFTVLRKLAWWASRLFTQCVTVLCPLPDTCLSVCLCVMIVGRVHCVCVWSVTWLIAGHSHTGMKVNSTMDVSMVTACLLEVTAWRIRVNLRTATSLDKVNNYQWFL